MADQEPIGAVMVGGGRSTAPPTSSGMLGDFLVGDSNIGGGTGAAPASSEPPSVAAVELTVAGTAPRAAAAFDMAWDAAEEVTLAGTAPVATATFNVAWDPAEEVTLAGTAPAATGSFSITAEVSVELARELTMQATGPAATASFDVAWDPSEELTLAGAAPVARATFDLDVTAPAVEVTLDGDAPPATASFDLSTTQPVTVTLAGSAPAGIGAFTTEFDPTEEIRLAGVAPRAIAAMSLEWVPVPLMRLEVLDPSLTRAPTAVTIALFDAQPGADVVFDIDGVVVATITADSSGAIGPVSLAVGEDVGAAGSHTITATQPGSETASDTFTLDHAPPAAPRVVGPDARAVEIPAAETSTGVRRWVLQDLMPGGLGSYVLPHNPTTMDNPHFEKPLEAMHTTAVGGVFHVFEGAGEPVTWRFNGYCPNKEMHDILLAYGALNRRFYIIDHRGRAWKVTFQNVDLVARKRQRTESGAWSDWAHDYTITALVYDQDWMVPA